MRAIPAMVLLAALLGSSASAAGAPFAAQSLERFFRVEWQARPAPSGAVVDGYVYNKTDMRTGQMQINIEQLDAGGRVLGETHAWVLGELPPASRAFFEARVPVAASYRVTVLTFSWMNKHGGP